MTVLPSYVQGRWTAPEGDGRPMLDAVTGEEVGRLSTDGLDMAAVADHGRRVGGPALRDLTFPQRASLLKALAGHLREHREELYAVSARTGATLGDSKFDVDGGIGVLAAYASKGKRELPSGHVLLDGDVEPLSKGGTFLAQHVMPPRARRRGAGQRLQLPGLGPAREARPAVPGRRPLDHQARDAHRVPHRGARRADRRLRSAARGHGAVPRRRRRRPVRPPHRAGPRVVHRLGVHGAAPAHAPDADLARGALHRRGRLAELLGARARRGRRARRSSTSTSASSSRR